MSELKPCPFCGWEPPCEDPDAMLDVLYPSGTWWADRPFYGKVYRTYRSHKEREEGDKQCWRVRCGNCGASVTDDGREEVSSKWNQRAHKQEGER